MDFLYLLESVRTDWLNDIMLAITTFGEETAFLVIALIVFWCVDKYKGYFVLGVGLFGTLISQFMKLLCRVPRPWVKDEKFTIVEQAREAAAGYSFPSGHTQTAVGTFGSIAASSQKKSVVIMCVAVAVLTAFSRMYLGVHTPADVLVGAAISIALIFGLKPLMLGKNKKYIPWVFGVMLILSGAFLAYVELYPFPADLDAHNYESALKNSYTLIGCCSGILLTWFVDEKKLHFETKAVWWAQIIKVVFGLFAVLAVKEGLRSPLEMLFGNVLIARAVRYFLIVVMAGVVWPLTFRYFSKLGNDTAEEVK